MDDKGGRAAVYAVGNAIIDIISEVDEEFLNRNNLTKGSTRLVDAYRARRLRNQHLSPLVSAGGSASNTAAALASLGVRSILVGAIGDDELGIQFTRSADIDNLEARLTILANRTTSHCIVHVTPGGQRTMSTHLDAAAHIPVEALDAEAIGRCSVMLLEGYLWNAPQTRTTAVEAISIARRNETVEIAFGASSLSCIEANLDLFQELIVSGDIDILFANEEEALALSGEDDFDAALHELSKYVSTVVTTRGPDGACAVVRGERFDMPAVAIEEVVDTTGAGDCFAAGYLHGHVNGLTPKDCLWTASVVAAEAISHMGARPETDLRRLVGSSIAPSFMTP